jgi:ATP-dependent Zn protease
MSQLCWLQEKNKRIVTLIEFEEAKDKVMMGSERTFYGDD